MYSAAKLMEHTSKTWKPGLSSFLITSLLSNSSEQTLDGDSQTEADVSIPKEERQQGSLEYEIFARLPPTLMRANKVSKLKFSNFRAHGNGGERNYASHNNVDITQRLDHLVSDEQVLHEDLSGRKCFSLSDSLPYSLPNLWQMFLISQYRLYLAENELNGAYKYHQHSSPQNPLGVEELKFLQLASQMQHKLGRPPLVNQRQRPDSIGNDVIIEDGSPIRRDVSSQWVMSSEMEDDDIDVDSDQSSSKFSSRNTESALDALIHMTTSSMKSLTEAPQINVDPKETQVIRWADRESHLCKRRKTRTTFSNAQLAELEHYFHKQKYLTPSDRDRIAKHLGLSNTQVITWFQNRRAKLKRESEELERDLMAARKQQQNKFSKAPHKHPNFDRERETVFQNFGNNWQVGPTAKSPASKFLVDEFLQETKKDFSHNKVSASDNKRSLQTETSRSLMRQPPSTLFWSPLCEINY